MTAHESGSNVPARSHRWRTDLASYGVSPAYVSGGARKARSVAGGSLHLAHVATSRHRHDAGTYRLHDLIRTGWLGHQSACLHGCGWVGVVLGVIAGGLLIWTLRNLGKNLTDELT